MNLKAESEKTVRGSKPRMERRSLIGAVIAIAFLVAFFAQTKSAPQSWNDIARIATMESLVERGTWAIDHSPWVDQTKDKVFINGNFYSDKMPLLSLMGAGVYAVARQGLGASLAPGCRSCAYFWLTFVLVGIPAALMLWLFFDFARQAGAPLWSAAIGTFVMGLGTMIFPYALVFNHHVPAAAALFAGYYILTTNQADHRRWIFLAGLLATLAISFDALSWITATALFGIAVMRYRSHWMTFALGAAIPLAITCALDLQIAHTIVPAYLITSGYNYPGSAFPATVGGNGTPDDYAAYAFRMFLGGQGLFLYNPLIFFALAGALVVMLKRHHPRRSDALFVTLCFVVLCVYLALFTGNLGGAAYGERWFVAALPMLFSFIFFIPPLGVTAWKNGAWLVFLPLLALSIISSLQGAQNPWVGVPPPLQMTRDVNAFPIFGFKWNIKFP